MFPSHNTVFFKRLKLSRESLKHHRRITCYGYFVRMMLLTILAILAKESVVNFLISSGEYRKPQTEDWIFYAYKTKELYASQIVNRKILIVAGSNALFGINSKQIESSTGIPTVNLAVHASLGVEYILSKAKQILKPGDIILMPFEFELYHQTKDQQLLEKTLRNYIISYDHDYLAKLSLADRLKVLMYPSGINQEDIDIVKTILSNRSPFEKDAVYRRILEMAKLGECYTGKTLNRNGDETCNIGKFPTKDLKRDMKINATPKEPIDTSSAIRDFCVFANTYGITIVPLYPSALNYPDYDSDEYKMYFYEIKRFWLKQNIMFIDSPNQSLLAEKIMFNTSYHPNDKGRNLRTQNVINILKIYLAKK